VCVCDQCGAHARTGCRCQKALPARAAVCLARQTSPRDVAESTLSARRRRQGFAAAEAAPGNAVLVGGDAARCGDGTARLTVRGL
jgi:hypothetical protein